MITLIKNSLFNIYDKLIGWVQGAVEMIPNFLVAVIVITLFYFIAKKVRSFVRYETEKSSLKNTLTTLLATTSYLAVLILGIFIALEILKLGKAVTSLLAGAGIIGLALAFAFQDIISNYVSGIIMALRDIFQVDDLVKTNDFFGKIKRVGLRTTTINLPTGETVRIPNAQILQNPLINYTENGQRRVDVAVGVSYDTNLEDAIDASKEAIKNVEDKQSDKTEVYFQEFNDSSIDFVVRFWIPFTNKQAEYLKAQSQAIQAIKNEFDERGLDIPFPIRTLDVDDDILNSLRD